MVQVAQAGVQGGSAVAEKRVNFAYNAAGQFTSIDRFADLAGTELVAATSYTYDGIGRLTGLTHEKGATVLADYGWSYDAFSRVTQYTFDSLIGGQGQSDYTYDATGQLTGADHDYQADENYTYDENGNRTTSGYSTGDNNQLLSDGTYNYTYDAEGNRTRRTEIATGAYVDYAWDHRNRLVALEYRDSQGVLLKKVEYDYDVWNRRIAKRVDANGDATFDEAFAYVYDDSGKHDPSTGVPLDDIVLVFDDSGSLISRNLHGPGIDQVLASEAFSPTTAGELPTAEGDVYWALADNLGSVRDIVAYDSGTGQTNVVNHIEYDAFGNITGETAAAGMDYALERYLYSYTGREWDADAELFVYRARWSDPVVGRFISEDPIGFAAGDTNISRYVGNGVTNATDPSGLEGFQFRQDAWIRHRVETGDVPDPPESPYWKLFQHFANPFITHHAVDTGDSICQWGARTGQAMTIIGGGAAVVAKVGVGKAAAFVATEAVETVVEEVTGVPVITDPKDLAEVLTKKGGKKAAQQVDDALGCAPARSRTPYRDPQRPPYNNGKIHKDHIQARGLDGPDTPANIQDLAAETNLRKGGHEGALKRYEQYLRQNGMSPQDARRVIQDEIKSLGKSPPPRPTDPNVLDRLPDNPLDQGYPY